MGKKIVIVGADFSSVNIDGGSPTPTPTPTVVTAVSKTPLTFTNDRLNTSLSLHSASPALTNQISKVKITITGASVDVGNLNLIAAYGSGSYPSFVTEPTSQQAVDTMLTVDQEILAAVLTKIAEPGNASLMIQSVNNLSAEAQEALGSATVTATFYTA
jgi:hypothetical protein